MEWLDVGFFGMVNKYRFSFLFLFYFELLSTILALVLSVLDFPMQHIDITFHVL